VVQGVNVLQVYESEPFLKQFCISLGAMTRSEIDKERKVTHIQYALKHYGSGIQGIREFVSRGPTSGALQIILPASLMICCFELQRDNQKAVVHHVRSTLKLVQQRITKERTARSMDFDNQLVAAVARLDRSYARYCGRIEKQMPVVTQLSDDDLKNLGNGGEVGSSIPVSVER
jgi:hypothetical protein